MVDGYPRLYLRFLYEMFVRFIFSSLKRQRPKWPDHDKGIGGVVKKISGRRGGL